MKRAFLSLLLLVFFLIGCRATWVEYTSDGRPHLVTIEIQNDTDCLMYHNFKWVDHAWGPAHGRFPIAGAALKPGASHVLMYWPRPGMYNIYWGPWGHNSNKERRKYCNSFYVVIPDDTFWVVVTFSSYICRDQMGEVLKVGPTKKEQVPRRLIR